MKDPIDDDAPEWTKEDFARAKPFKEVFPEQFKSWETARRGRPPVDDPKRQITLRIRGSLVDALKSHGRGYMARVEKVIEEAIAKGVL